MVTCMRARRHGNLARFKFDILPSRMRAMKQPDGRRGSIIVKRKGRRARQGGGGVKQGKKNIYLLIFRFRSWQE